MNEMSMEALRFIFRHYYGIKTFPESGDHQAAMKAVMICAKGDGTLSEPEKAWISGMSAMVGNPFYTLAHTYEADEAIEDVVAASPWLSQFGGRMIVFEAIRAAAADGELHDGEVAVIKRFARAIGVEESVVSSLVQLHEEETQLLQRRLALLWPESSPLHE